LIPNLHRLMTTDGAAIGAHADAIIHASGPEFASLPGYLELMSGRSDTGCANNDCAGAHDTTLADDVAHAGGETAVFSSWPAIGRAISAARHVPGILASVGRHGGRDRERIAGVPGVTAWLQAGERFTPELGEHDFRADAHTAEAALSYWEARRPRLLFVALGETDEYAHADDYRAYLDALHRVDAIIGRFARRAAQHAARGRPTTLLVTTDHGRADGFIEHGGQWPESARIWLVAAGSGIRAHGYVKSPLPRRLADIAPTIRHLMRMPPRSEGRHGEVLDELFDASASAFVLTST
jgi:hypothetical protein